MLPKSRRLNLNRDFSRVVAGKKVETHSFKLFFKNGESENPLVGIALSKQYFKKAHDRNKARRISSQAIQSVYNSLRINLNLVIMPKTAVLEKTAEQLIEELKNVKYLYQDN